MKAANVERIAESDKSGCFMAGKCGSVEFFAHFSAICAKKQLPQKRSPPEGACQPLCSAKRPPRPLVGDRRGFLNARLHENPAKTPHFALWQIGEELIGAASQAKPYCAARRPAPAGAGRHGAAAIAAACRIRRSRMRRAARAHILHSFMNYHKKYPIEKKPTCKMPALCAACRETVKKITEKSVLY